MITIPEFPKTKKLKSLAVLTSGGDAPGMNAAVRAVVRYSIANDIEVFGIMKGYSGLLEGQIEAMKLSSVANIIQRGGTVLKTSRCPEFMKKQVRKEAAYILERKGIEGLVVIGGDGSFAGASLLEKETGFRTIGVPGTIDNDIFGTDDTIGFDTAVNTAIEAIDRIRDTASSHGRLFLVEVMGRNSGFIALSTGIGGGAETIVVPEAEMTLPMIRKSIERGMNRGKTSSIIVVAEGPKPGLATRIGRGLEKAGFDSKICTLGHIQRGGVPTAHDRMLGSVLGAAAVAYLASGKSGGMVGITRNEVAFTPFKEVIGKKKTLPKVAMALAEILAT
ncbi:MAG: 6-phosphofructokinase [Cryobacterium sp.]|nr:6-phosphofructokinase [Oligoflexia bacterium]